ncbi:SixA phosphatase family protein [Robiginitomaculum antarcticum]|uniref:SixA phosphatase family protein n=1 Tax=Robiginitomaculum antarcticum TaxID=437507 RepID=UPI00037E1DFB|nr:histidine phosphatase family protein [Robiginitomaculum antarcticum]
MLETLLLMRHAKSSWENKGLVDHARPLNSRGRKSADIVGRTLTARGFAPNEIWSSDSARTLETAKRLIRIIPGAQSIRHIPDLYHSSAADIRKILKNYGEPDCTSLMVLAHNPGISEFFEDFSRRAHPFPTACCAVFKRKNDGDWLNQNNWLLTDILVARQLMEE